MRYDLGDALHRQLFKTRANKLFERGAIVELREVKARRTLSQNAIFHLWVAVIADSIGEYDREQVKSDIKSLFLGKQRVHNRFTDKDEEQEFRTSKLTKEQMSDLLTRIKHWATEELGIYLPTPEDNGFAEMQERYS